MITNRNWSRGFVFPTPLIPKPWWDDLTEGKMIASMPDEIREGEDILQEDAYDPESEIGDGADEEDDD